MKKRNKFLAALLVTTMLVLMIGGITVFAAEDVKGPVEVRANEETGDQTVEVGDVTSEGVGVDIWADDGKSADVTTGNITADSDGIDVFSSDESEVSVQAETVESGADGVSVMAASESDVSIDVKEIYAGKDGINVMGFNDSAISVTTDDIEADEDGVSVWTLNGADASVETGDIVNAGYTGIEVDAEEEGSYVTISTGDISDPGEDGINVLAKRKANVTIDTGDIEGAGGRCIAVLATEGAYVDILTGDVSTDDSEKDRYAVNLNAKDGAMILLETEDLISTSSGARVDADFEESQVLLLVNGSIVSDDWSILAQSADGGEISILVEGSVLSATDDSANLFSGENAPILMFVKGDVTGVKDGIYAYISEGGYVIAVVEGVLFGELCSIAIDEDSVDPADTLTVVAWKIIPNQDGIVAGNEKYGETRTYTRNEDVEKNINYIIKVEQPEAGGYLYVTDENGNALAELIGYEVANEGDKVLLKADVEDGYILKAAYNGDGEKVELLKDEAGNYYVIVPKGGGIYLSVELEKKSDDGGSSVVVDPTNAVASGIPKTGDTNGIILWVSLLGAALLAVAAAVVIRRKTREK